MALLLKTSVQENPMGKNCYTKLRHNACLPPIDPDLQYKVGVLFRRACYTQFGLFRLVAHV